MKYSDKNSFHQCICLNSNNTEPIKPGTYTDNYCTSVFCTLKAHNKVHIFGMSVKGNINPHDHSTCPNLQYLPHLIQSQRCSCHRSDLWGMCQETSGSGCPEDPLGLACRLGRRHNGVPARGTRPAGSLHTAGRRAPGSQRWAEACSSLVLLKMSLMTHRNLQRNIIINGSVHLISCKACSLIYTNN